MCFYDGLAYHECVADTVEINKKLNFIHHYFIAAVNEHLEIFATIEIFKWLHNRVLERESKKKSTAFFTEHVADRKIQSPQYMGKSL